MLAGCVAIMGTGALLIALTPPFLIVLLGAACLGFGVAVMDAGLVPMSRVCPAPPPGLLRFLQYRCLTLALLARRAFAVCRNHLERLVLA